MSYPGYSLDLHITGNWGEDSVDHSSDCGEDCSYCHGDERELCQHREDLMDQEFIRIMKAKGV